MGVFNAISTWANDRYEKRISNMKEQGKCPECNGTGIGVTYEHTYSCIGCSGTGSFEDWMR